MFGGKGSRDSGFLASEWAVAKQNMKKTWFWKQAERESDDGSKKPIPCLP